MSVSLQGGEKRPKAVRVEAWELRLLVLTPDSPDVVACARHEVAACSLATCTLEHVGWEVVNGQRTIVFLCDVPLLLLEMATQEPAFDPTAILYSFWRVPEPDRELAGAVVLERPGRPIVVLDADEVRIMLHEFRPDRPGSQRREAYESFLRVMLGRLMPASASSNAHGEPAGTLAAECTKWN